MTFGAPMPNQHTSEMLVSYLRVRKLLGVLGMMLPVILIVGGLLVERIEPSISDFCYTLYRDVFVGTLFAIGAFLVAYEGHTPADGEWFDDDLIANVAGVAAFGLALFPNDGRLQPEIEVTVTQFIGAPMSAGAHYFFAFLFFVSLGLMNLLKFSKTENRRDRASYVTCGWVIFAMIGAIAVAKQFEDGPESFVKAQNVVFWAEAIGIWAFGISWGVKGDADLTKVRNVIRFRRISR